MSGIHDLQAVTGSLLFAGTPATCRDQLVASSHIVEVEAGTVVQSPGETISRLFLVMSGTLHVVHSDRAGHRRIVRIIGREDHYGLTELALDCPARHLVEAAEPCVLAEIPFDALRKLSVECPELQRSLNQALARKNAECEHLLISLTSEDVVTRVVSYLLSLPRLPDSEGLGRSLVRLPVSQADLASHLGTTPESVSRRLHDLIGRGEIERTGSREFALDEELLAEY